MNFQLLDWDSQFFGFKVGKILPSRLASDSLGEVLKKLRSAGVSLAYWAADSGDIGSQEAAAKWNGFLADRKTTYTIDLSKVKGSFPAGRDEIKVRESAEPGKALEDLALISGQYSRFKTDPRIPSGKFEELYRRWIARAAQGILAEKVLVFYSGHQAAGMITVGLREGVGEIGLLAVEPQFGGKGVGTALVQAAQTWFIQKECGRGSVVTQGSNEPARRLYEKCGYAVEKIENFYHFWLDGNL